MKTPLKLIEVLLVAVTYIVLARVGQFFAIDPGNITPLWFPSGVMVAWTLLRGRYIWPGVFLGAFSGNIWAYFSTDSFYDAMSTIAAATMNGIGDVVACVVMTEIICLLIGSRNPFHKVQNLTWFVSLGVLAGPLISALMGVGGLVLFGIIAPDRMLASLGVWFFGDALGVLIFTPIVVTWCSVSRIKYTKEILGLSFLLSYAIIVTAIGFDLVGYPRLFEAVLLMGIPLALYGFLHFSQRVAFTVLLVVGAVSLISTVNGKGPFAQDDLSIAIMELQYFLGVFSLCIYVIGVFLSNNEEVTYSLIKQKAELETLYRRDQLTNTWNRYRIKEFLEYELSRFKRYGTRFGLILFDIDDFKKVNDRLGHVEGDKLLVELCNLVQEKTRKVDLFGRWGGEEFVIIVEDTGKTELEEFANKICKLIAENKFGVGEQTTVSVGSTLVSDCDTALSIFDRVDEALYQSKRNGKNRVTVI